MESLFKSTSIEKNIGTKQIKKEISEVFYKCIPCRETDRPKTTRKAHEKARSNIFNNSIAIDLTEWYIRKKQNNTMLCHIIDEISRISSAKIVPDKNAETIIRALFEVWLSKSGTPCKILHDLGGEFTNEKWETITEPLGIRDTTTAAYSPFRNGVVERYNAVIENTMTKINADPELNFLSQNHILNYAVMA